MKKVIIIGGGVSGLAAGIYCRKLGLGCTILEKHSEIGGNLTGWFRNGCYIDNCIHWLNGTNSKDALYSVWKELGIINNDADLYQAKSFFESELDGENIAFSADAEVTRLNMLLLSPCDSKEINRFIDAVEAVADFMSERSSLVSAARAYAIYRRISLSALAERFSHPLLKTAFTDYFGGDFSAIALIWAYAAFTCGNAKVPLGGSKNAADRVAERLRELGGEILTRSEVVRINTDGERHASGVKLNDGRVLVGDAIICACDPTITFGKILPEKLMPSALTRCYNTPEKFLRFSSIHAAFVCDSRNIPEFGTRVIACESPAESGCGRVIVKEFAHESNYAPDGKTVLQTMMFQNENDSMKWINSNNYAENKSEYIYKMKNALIRSFPTCEASLELLDAWTPATYKRYFGSESGSYMGFALTPRTALKTIDSRIKGLDNVFIATQWQTSPGGLPNAARAGKKAAFKAFSTLCK